MEKKFITTTLPYSNSPKAHIGHAFEFIIGDVLARYYRNKIGSENVIFNIGLDEHGKKISNEAERQQMLIFDYLDRNEVAWRKFCHLFEISFDNFYRTTDYPHHSKAQRVWLDLRNKDLIYKKEYSAKYCNGCESFKTEKDLEDGRCPDHSNIDIIDVSEINYFFKLSSFKEQLFNLFEEDKGILQPSSKKNEVLKVIEGLQDISISRDKKNVHWGVQVPGDDSQTMYVWFEAILNYVFAAGYLSKISNFEKNWENAIQIFGPDNLKFQAVIFQGLLLALEIKNTSFLLCHGSILDGEGKKMSKSVGNVIDPLDQFDKYGLDAIKYYALVGLGVYDNSAWDEKRLVELYNSHLADDYGNLLSRVVVLVSKGLKDNRFIQDPNIDLDYSLIESEKITYLIREQVSEIKDLWELNRITEALLETNKLVKWCNKYINDKQPWKKEAGWWSVLLELHYIMILVTDLYKPVFPQKAKEALRSLNELEKIILFSKITENDN